MLLANQAFARQRQLQRENNDRADARAGFAAVKAAENSLRGNFEGSPVVKQAQTVVSEYNKILDLSAKKTGASDTGMVYSFIKLLDTQTGVREGEQKQVQASGSVAERVGAFIGQWTVGTRLTDAQRDKLVAAAETIADSHKQSFEDYRGWYTRNAAEAGVDPAKVIYDPYESKKVRKTPEEERIERMMGRR